MYDKYKTHMTDINHWELWEFYSEDEIDWGSYLSEFGYSHHN